MTLNSPTIIRPDTIDNRRPDVFERLSPKQGWDSFFFLLIAFGVVAFTVRESNWVQTPGIFSMVFLSTTTGLILSKIRVPWPLAMIIGITTGTAFITIAASAIAEGNTITDRFIDISSRLQAWYEAAISGGISTDLLPFSLILLSATWVLGFFSALALFRWSNPWVGLILIGLAMLTNLSFLADQNDLRFFVFLFFGMMLLTRITLVQRQDRWNQSNIGFISGGWFNLRIISLLVILILLSSAIIPLRVYVSKIAVDVWDIGRSPLTNIESEFDRLFSGIKSKKNLPGRFFGDTLPFQGEISFDGEIVIKATSEHRSYWLYRTYSEYSSQGWLTGNTTEQVVDFEPTLDTTLLSSDRKPVMQSLQVDFNTNSILTGGTLDWLSRTAIAKTLAPKSFLIDILDTNDDKNLPDEIKVIEWTHRNSGRDRGSYRARDLELVSESR